MSAKRDFYEVLGITRDADAAAIKSAYRKLALKYHPDRNKDDKDAEKKFKEVSEAFAILSDPEKRATYDQFGHAGMGQGMGGGANMGEFEDIIRSAFGGRFEDLFGEMFGGGMRGGSRRGVRRGADLRLDVEISLEDAFSGVRKDVKIPVSELCETCSGSGAKPGTQPETCNTCGGAGQVRSTQGFFTVARTCPRCSGKGQVIAQPCKSCHGSGETRKERHLSVDIPAGVDDGTRIRLSGDGDRSAGSMQPGDLYLFVHVKDHNYFERDGSDLYFRANVPMARAALGGDIEVPTIEGSRARLNIPEGAQTGRRCRLRGKGMPALRGSGSSDMYVEIFVETPRKLTDRQRELLNEFQTERGDETAGEEQGFASKLKNLWGT